MMTDDLTPSPFETGFDAVVHDSNSQVFWFFKGGLCWAVFEDDHGNRAASEPIEFASAGKATPFEGLPAPIDAITLQNNLGRFFAIKDKETFEAKRTGGGFVGREEANSEIWFPEIPDKIDAFFFFNKYKTRSGEHYLFFSEGNVYRRDKGSVSLKWEKPFDEVFKDPKGDLEGGLKGDLDAAVQVYKNDGDPEVIWLFKGADCYKITAEGDLPYNTGPKLKIRDEFPIRDLNYSLRAFSRGYDNFFLAPDQRLLISAPHNGQQDLDPGYLRVREEYKCGKDEGGETFVYTNVTCGTTQGGKFTTLGDSYTKKIAEDLLEHALDQDEKTSLSYNIGEIHRKYIDYNRAPACAGLDCQYIRVIYDAFHSIYKMHRDNNTSGAMVFDIHGFNKKTKNRGDWRDIRVGGGDEYSTAPKGLVSDIVEAINELGGSLQAVDANKESGGTPLNPVAHSPGSLNGGTIVKNFSDGEPVLFPGVQFELSDIARKPENRPTLIKALWTAVLVANDYSYDVSP